MSSAAVLEGIEQCRGHSICVVSRARDQALWHAELCRGSSSGPTLTSEQRNTGLARSPHPLCSPSVPAAATHTTPRRCTKQGGTCGFGTDGQKARAGSSVRPGFEGGQTPLYRRLPKLRGIAGGECLVLVFRGCSDPCLPRGRAGGSRARGGSGSSGGSSTPRVPTSHFLLHPPGPLHHHPPHQPHQPNTRHGRWPAQVCDSQPVRAGGRV